MVTVMVFCVTGQGFVNRIVHHLVHQVMKALNDMSPMYIAGRLRTASNPQGPEFDWRHNSLLLLPYLYYSYNFFRLKTLFYLRGEICYKDSKFR